MSLSESSLIVLQELVSHQEEEIARLSAELYAQQKELMVMKTEILSLKTMVKSSLMQDSPIRSVDQETPPPHY